MHLKTSFKKLVRHSAMGYTLGEGAYTGLDRFIPGYSLVGRYNMVGYTGSLV